jgi:methyl-accepting chemotaxis protein
MTLKKGDILLLIGLSISLIFLIATTIETHKSIEETKQLIEETERLLEETEQSFLEIDQHIENITRTLEKIEKIAQSPEFKERMENRRIYREHWRN